MTQPGNLLLKLKREMVNYSRKSVTVTTGSIYFKTRYKSKYHHSILIFLKWPYADIIVLKSNIFFSETRLQVDAISRLSSFVMEKQESDIAKRAVTEAHERNEDLLKRNEDLLKRNDDLIKKIEDSSKIVTQLQEALQRCARAYFIFDCLK
jgi:hypothetical protein